MKKEVLSAHNVKRHLPNSWQRSAKCRRFVFNPPVALKQRFFISWWLVIPTQTTRCLFDGAMKTADPKAAIKACNYVYWPVVASFYLLRYDGFTRAHKPVIDFVVLLWSCGFSSLRDGMTTDGNLACWGLLSTRTHGDVTTTSTGAWEELSTTGPPVMVWRSVLSTCFFVHV